MIATLFITNNKTNCAYLVKSVSINMLPKDQSEFMSHIPADLQQFVNQLVVIDPKLNDYQDLQQANNKFKRYVLCHSIDYFVKELKKNRGFGQHNSPIVYN